MQHCSYLGLLFSWNNKNDEKRFCLQGAKSLEGKSIQKKNKTSICFIWNFRVNKNIRMLFQKRFNPIVISLLTLVKGDLPWFLFVAANFTSLSTYLIFQILEKLFPCAIVTPLDCFWEGSKLLKTKEPVKIP